MARETEYSQVPPATRKAPGVSWRVIGVWVRMPADSTPAANRLFEKRVQNAGGNRGPGGQLIGAGGTPSRGVMRRMEMTDARDLLAEVQAKGRPPGHDRRPAAQAQSFRQTAGQPMTIRRALAFCALLDALEPVLHDHDCLAGSLAAVSGAGEPTHPDDQQVLDSIGRRGFPTHADHVVIDFPRLLRLGFLGIRAEIARRLAQDGDLDDDGRHMLTSMDIAVAGAIRYLGRYADACRRRAAAAPALEAKRWGEMADRCDRLTREAPASFPDAVQLTWFAHHLLALDYGYANGFGRLDQYLYPFYRADVERGALTPEEALQWVLHLWAKIGERSPLWGHDEVANIAVGGVRPDGGDGTNDLSYLCLEATRTLRIVGPNLSARFHEGTPDRFYHECLQTIATGVGYPALFNDRVLVPALESIGIPTADARDYALVGCIETFLPGKQPPWADGRFNLPKCLELALGNGRDLRTGEVRGPETGDPVRFRSLGDLLNALAVQIRHGVRQYADSFRELNRAVPPRDFTNPFLSALMTDCVEHARDVNDGGTRYRSTHGVAGMGIGTIADSLAAIRRGVFEERRFSMETLLAALRADFAGYETLQAWAWNRAPKYGNDDPAADELAAWVADTFCEAVLSERTYDGGRFLPLIAANISNIYAGHETAATPDGRRAGHPLSDAASPTYGRDSQGPTAVVASVTRVNWRQVVGGSVLNQKFHPGVLANPEGRERLAGLLRTFLEQGGQEMQLNVVTAERLKEAIQHPEEHQDLVVRVSGFSARFVQLAREVQEDILARTTHLAA